MCPFFFLGTVRGNEEHSAKDPGEEGEKIFTILQLG